MQIKQLNLNEVDIKSNVLLAPMAGFTDYSFRKLVGDTGYGLCFTELVSAKGLCYKSPGSDALLYCGGDYKGTAAQIFGSEPYYMRKAIESDYLAPFDVIDINMGCPVPKVFKNGEGSALLKDISKAESVVKECVKSGKTITVKIRIGQKAGDDVAAEFASMAEACGAAMVTVHGRVRENYYSGEPDFKAIARAKNAVKIPVIANGGIFTVQDADAMIDKTGADGVMIARGAVADPFIAARLTGTLCDFDLKRFMLSHIRLRKELYGQRRAALEFRKFVNWYLKGVKDGKSIKSDIYDKGDADGIIDYLTSEKFANVKL